MASVRGWPPQMRLPTLVKPAIKELLWRSLSLVAGFLMMAIAGKLPVFVSVVITQSYYRKGTLYLFSVYGPKLKDGKIQKPLQ